MPWSNSVWSLFWEVAGLGLPILLAIVTGIWFTWGGVRDMMQFFNRMKHRKINHLDDGTVVDHQNLDEYVSTGASETLLSKDKTPLS